MQEKLENILRAYEYRIYIALEISKDFLFTRPILELQFYLYDIDGAVFFAVKFVTYSLHKNPNIFTVSQYKISRVSNPEFILTLYQDFFNKSEHV